MITNTLLAGSWLSTAVSGVFIIVAIILMVMRNGKTMSAKAAAGTNASRWAGIRAAILNKPTLAIELLTVGGVAFFVQALAYWAMFFGIGITGGVYWGTQLGWIFFFFFVGKALADYVCQKPDWKFFTMYAMAGVGGAHFVGDFVGAANLAGFVALGGALALFVIIEVAMFRDRFTSDCGKMDPWVTIIIGSFVLVVLVGYYLPYILSPVFTFAISQAATLIWFLCADFLVVIWFVIAAATAMDCEAVKKALIEAGTKAAMETPGPATPLLQKSNMQRASWKQN